MRGGEDFDVEGDTVGVNIILAGGLSDYVLPCASLVSGLTWH